MTDYYIPLLPGNSYHILSRAVGDEKIFRQTSDYEKFLFRFQNHVSPIADTFSYCLLPNHFHFLIRTKDESHIEEQFERVKNKQYSTDLAPAFIMERLSNLLNSYAKSFNHNYSRKGALFIDYLRRVEIATHEQLTNTLFYIHRNPIHHGYCQSLEEWQWSSYNELLSNRRTHLRQQEVLDWFDGKQGFIDFHSQKMKEFKMALLC